MNWMIVTKGKEVALGNDMFGVEKEGYRLYPVGMCVEIGRTKETPYGTAKIIKVTWGNDITTIEYKLESLYSTN